MKLRLARIIGAFALGITASINAAVYPGNNNTGFGGPIGKGSLSLSDDGTTVSATFTKGTSGFNDVLILYLDTGSGSGIRGTTNFTDSADGLRRAISGLNNGAANQSTLAFPPGFQGAYAIALGPASDSFGGLWQLVEGGSHTFVNSVNLAPTGTANAASYTFSFPVTDLGLTPSSGATIKFIGTYISNTGYRSTEAVGCDATGTQGWNPFTTTTNASYVIRTASTTPPQITGISPTNGTIYVDPATQVSFTVNSPFSGLRSNNIALILNGTLRTNLSFSGDAHSWSVTDIGGGQGPLVPNLIYSGVITATDIDNNSATNTFTFNTWAANNPFIEAEDYNFSSGAFVLNAFPDAYNNYAGLIGSNGVDYLEYDTSGANNAYRPTDLPQVEPATDIDHAGYAGGSYTDYNLAFIENGEWENYTRVMSNQTYAVYARMAGFGNSATMLMERLATPTATSSNQPRASLGTFICPNTGGAQNWTFVALKDFFSNPVLVKFPGTNTFRNTDIGGDGNYNVNYVIFVPVTNSATLRPYLSAGFPYSSAVVMPDQTISFTIANAQTAVNPASIQLFLNASNVTSGVTLSNNAAGSFLRYQSPALLPPGTNTLQVIFSDGTVSQTNQWPFIVQTLPVIPAAYALASSQAGAPGFNIQIAKADDTAPPADFPPTIARALLHLAGMITNANTSQPYPNLAAGPNNDGLYVETNEINYDINATTDGNSTFNFKAAFPYVPANTVNNFISMAANMYVRLSPGVWTFAVRSDDGFELATGPSLGSTNLLLGIFDGGRGDNTPTTFSFIVQTNGLYPMRLIYDQGEFGGSIELYSIKSGQSVLLNDLSNPNAVMVYQTLAAASPLTILNPRHSGHSTTFSFQTQSGHNYTVQFKKALTDASWLTLQTVAGNGSITNITDNTATNAARFYRIAP